MQRVEWIVQTVCTGGARHELGDTLRPGRAYSVRPEAAFLLDEVGKERSRKVVLRGDGFVKSRLSTEN